MGNECKSGTLLAGDHGQQFLASWAFQIGELLTAQTHTVAWSGLGMVRNCCGGNTTMPSIFGRTLATVNKDDTWDWSSWKPTLLSSISARTTAPRRQTRSTHTQRRTRSL